MSIATKGTNIEKVTDTQTNKQKGDDRPWTGHVTDTINKNSSLVLCGIKNAV